MAMQGMIIMDEALGKILVYIQVHFRVEEARMIATLEKPTHT